MINRHARQIAAEALRSFMDGSISNKEYERRYPSAKGDDALLEIYVQIWFLYADVETHFLTAERAPNDEDRAVLERCILFLQSDVEYQWPRQKLRLRFRILRLLGLGRTGTQREEGLGGGDKKAWPFWDQAQYAQAKTRRLT
jgi:hypothetical protein